MEHPDPGDGRLNILRHLKEPDSFLMVVVAAGVALVLILIAALVILAGMGDNIVPPGHSHIQANSQTQRLLTAFEAGQMPRSTQLLSVARTSLSS